MVKYGFKLHISLLKSPAEMVAKETHSILSFASLFRRPRTLTFWRGIYALAGFCPWLSRGPKSSRWELMLRLEMGSFQAWSPFSKLNIHERSNYRQRHLLAASASPTNLPAVSCGSIAYSRERLLWSGVKVSFLPSSYHDLLWTLTIGSKLLLWVVMQRLINPILRPCHISH